VEGDCSDSSASIDYNEKALKQMQECERHVHFANPSDGSATNTSNDCS